MTLGNQPLATICVPDENIGFASSKPPENAGGLLGAGGVRVHPAIFALKLLLEEILDLLRANPKLPQVGKHGWDTSQSSCRALQ